MPIAGAPTPEPSGDAGSGAPSGRPDPRQEVAQQVELASSEYGPGFPQNALALTLLMYRCIAALDQAHSIELAPAELTGSEFNVLTVLHRTAEPLTLGRLAEAVSVRPPNLTSVVSRLRERGFVERVTNPADRRSGLVRISEQGNAFLARFMPGHWKFLTQLYAALSAKEQDALVATLGKLLGGLESGGTAAQLSDMVVEVAQHFWPPAGAGALTNGRSGRRPANRYIPDPIR